MSPGRSRTRTHRRASRAVALALLVLILTAVGCGSSGGVAPASQVPIDPNAVRIVASGQQFVTKEASAPADKPFQIVFESQTSDLHNIAIGVAGSDPIFRSEVVSGPATRAFPVEPLTAGTYTFRCDLHASMIGTLTVR